ncbi:MAG TPA: glycosyltransferase family 9 protein [Terriglobales bacterium]|jgi:heptosyltransferase-1
MADLRDEIREQRYDVAIDFQGAVRSALVAKLSAAPIIFGFRQPRENAAAMFYTRQVQVRGGHIIEQNLSLASAVTQEDSPGWRGDLPRDEAAERDCEQKFGSYYRQGFAILNPGAGWGAKQWPAVRYGEVAKRLADELGVKSLINFGPGEEKLALTAALASGSSARAITCSVTELIALTRRARIFVGGDTGPMHLAAALGVPVVAIFGPTNPARNGPYGTRCVVLRSLASPTTFSHRPEPDEGMLGIAAEDVTAAAISLLKDRHE